MTAEGQPEVTPAPGLLTAVEALGMSGEKAAHFIKFGHLDYPRGGGIALANGLISRGVPLHERTLPQNEPNLNLLAFNINGETLEVTDAEGGANVTCTVGPFDATAPVLTQLAKMTVTGDHGRTVETHEKSLSVSLNRVFDPADADRCLSWVNELCMRYREELGTAECAYDNGDAMPDLIDHFARAGLGVPHLPEQVAHLLRRRQEWSWSSITDGPSEAEDYLFDHRVQAYLRGPVPDHAAICHSGHGFNSYALTWRAAHGPIALCVQAAWGGALSDPSVAVSKQAGLFHRASNLLNAIPVDRTTYSPEPRIRRLLVMYSNFRGQPTVHRWNGRALTWDDVTPDVVDETGEAAWWKAVEGLVDLAVLPE